MRCIHLSEKGCGNMAILLAGCLAVYIIVEQCAAEDRRQMAQAKRRKQIRRMDHYAETTV